MQAAKEWYVKLTGVKSYVDEPFYVGFDFNGCEMGLHPQDETITIGKQTISHWAVDGIEHCVQKLTYNGASVLHHISEVGGGIKVATVNNPWGNAVGLIVGA